MQLCKVPGCEREHCARGWCGTHYACWLRTGDPIPARRHVVPYGTTSLHRHGSRVEYRTKTPSGWQLAARVAYEQANGPIPSSREVRRIGGSVGIGALMLSRGRELVTCKHCTSPFVAPYSAKRKFCCLSHVYEYRRTARRSK
jgi:hypothetical protein